MTSAHELPPQRSPRRPPVATVALGLALALPLAPTPSKAASSPLQLEFTVTLEQLAAYADAVIEATFADPAHGRVEVPLEGEDCGAYTALVYDVDVVSVLAGPPHAAGQRLRVREANHETLLAAGRMACREGFAAAPPTVTLDSGTAEVKPGASAILFLTRTAAGDLALAAGGAWLKADAASRERVEAALRKAVGSPFGRLHPVPSKPKRKELDEFLTRDLRRFDLSRLFSGMFHKDGSFSDDSTTMYREAFFGEWVGIEQDGVLLEGEISRYTDTEGCNLGYGDENCFESRPAEYGLGPVELSGRDLMLLTEERGRCAAAIACNPSVCEPACSVQVMPGHADRGLRGIVRATLPGMAASGPLKEMVFIEGPQARNPRERSEIWYRGDTAAEAKKLAEKLAPVVGAVEVREWTWGGPYDLILIVGRTR